LDSFPPDSFLAVIGSLKKSKSVFLLVQKYYKSGNKIHFNGILGFKKGYKIPIIDNKFNY